MIEEAEVLAAAGPGLEAGIKQFAEPEGSVIEGVATGGAVVAVEVALAVADPHPLGHQVGEALAELARQLHHLLREGQGRINRLAVVAIDQMGRDHLQFLQGLGMGLAPGPAGEQLQLAHPQERRRHPGGDRSGVVDHHIGIERSRLLRIPGAQHPFPLRSIERQRAGGGHPQGMHELLGQKLAHAGAQHRPAIGSPAVRGRATALELHLPALACKHPFEHREGAAIAIAVARAEGALTDVFRAVDREGVARGPAVGRHRSGGNAGITGEPALEGGVVGERVAQPQLPEQAAAVGHVRRLRQRRGGHGHVMAGEHLPRPVVMAIAGGVRIPVQRLQQGIVRVLCKGRERGGGGHRWRCCGLPSSVRRL